ncbi:MAG: DUF2807 domain-containing protein [Erysipelotrichales bacterium]|nr:DUF2807 domain-containing protein [Erysipelotrichales bacterium]
MKKLSVIIVLIILTFVISGCGNSTIRANGIMIDGQFSLEGQQINEINFSFPGNVNLTTTASDTVTWRIDENLVEHLAININSQGLLRIEVRRESQSIGFNLTDSGGIEFNVGITSIRNLRVSGVSDVIVRGAFEATNFGLTMSGVSTVTGLEVLANYSINIEMSGVSTIRNSKFEAETLNLNAAGVSAIQESSFIGDELFFTLSGSSSLNAQGETEELTVTTSGTSSANLTNLLAVNGSITTNGASSVIINVSGSLQQSSSGVSSITNVA